MTHTTTSHRTRTRFKVFFERVSGSDHEAAMNKLLESVDDWLSEGNRSIVVWKWRHMNESPGVSGRIYVEVEVIYRETTVEESDGEKEAKTTDQ